MKKILSLFLLLSLFSIAFWQERFQSYDCNLLWWNAISSWEIIKQPEVDIAIKLLHSYCVESRQANQSDYENFENIPSAAQSPMFLDQCVSVGFRKLDANKKLMYPWLQPSTTWLAWQNFLAQETKRIDPFWRDNTMLEFQRVWGIGKSQSDNIWFAWQYHKVCNECSDTYDQMTRTQHSFNKESFNKWCFGLADKRIQAEQDFVEAFTNQKLNYTITNSVDNYLNVYIGQQRMPALLDKLNSSFSLFNIIGQKMGPWTQSCNY